MKRAAILPFIAVFIVFAVLPAAAYLKLGTQVGNRTVNLRWNGFPVRYFVTDRPVSGVTAQQFQTTVGAALPHGRRSTPLNCLRSSWALPPLSHDWETV